MAQNRLHLYGKKVTQDDILEEINRLLYGKGNRPFPLKPSEIGKVIGLNRASVYQYIKKLSQRGDLPKLPSGRLALPKVDEREYRRFNEHHEITSDPLVSEWMDDLLTRRRGLPIKCWKTKHLVNKGITRIEEKDMTSIVMDHSPKGLLEPVHRGFVTI